MSALTILRAGPGVTVQDAGRPGYLGQGLSRGGAADGLALAEGAALLRQPVGSALEMAGFGGQIVFDAPVRIALTGAPMRATLDGAALAWNASHPVPAGARLEIGGALRGVYGYLTVGGGFAVPEVLGGRGAHLAAGIGRLVQEGDVLPLGRDAGGETGLTLDVVDRFGGGELRCLPSLHTTLYPEAERGRFETTAFTRDTRGNRMGVRLIPEGDGFGLDLGQSILSEVIVPGDIQIPGDGAPYVLLSECQTTGGYPRIGTVIPADLTRVAQAAPGDVLRFRFVTRDAALETERRRRDHVAGLTRMVRPLVRDPATMTDLLSYTLISGVTAGEEP